MMKEEFKFRLSSGEKEVLRQKAEQANISQSELLRRFIMGETVRSHDRELILAVRALVNETNAIGVNINQIVHNVNMKRYTEYEKKKMFVLQQSLIEKVVEFTEKFYK